MYRTRWRWNWGSWRLNWCKSIIDFYFYKSLNNYKNVKKKEQRLKERLMKSVELEEIYQYVRKKVFVIWNNSQYRRYDQFISAFEPTFYRKEEFVKTIYSKRDRTFRKHYPQVEPIGLLPSSVVKTTLRFPGSTLSSYEGAVLERYRLIQYQILAILRVGLGIFLCPWLSMEGAKYFVIEPCFSFAWNMFHQGVFTHLTQQEKALAELKNLEGGLFFEKRLIYFPTAARFIGWRVGEIRIPYHQEIVWYEHRIFLLEQRNRMSICSLVIILSDAYFFSLFSTGIFHFFYEIVTFRRVRAEFFFALDDPLKCFLLYYTAELIVGYHSKNGWDVVLRYPLRRISWEENSQIVKFVIATLPVGIDTLFKYWIFRHLNHFSPTTTRTYYQIIELISDMFQVINNLIRTEEVIRIIEEYKQYFFDTDNKIKKNQVCWLVKKTFLVGVFYVDSHKKSYKKCREKISKPKLKRFIITPAQSDKVVFFLKR